MKDIEEQIADLEILIAEKQYTIDAFDSTIEELEGNLGEAYDTVANINMELATAKNEKEYLIGDLEDLKVELEELMEKQDKIWKEERTSEEQEYMNSVWPR